MHPEPLVERAAAQLHTAAAEARSIAAQRVGAEPDQQPATSGSAIQALEYLAAALAHDEFATALVTGIDGVPRLSVICRQTRLTERVHVESGRYWWAWGEAIGPTSDPAGTGMKVMATLHAFAGVEPAQ